MGAETVRTAARVAKLLGTDARRTRHQASVLREGREGAHIGSVVSEIPTSLANYKMRPSVEARQMSANEALADDSQNMESKEEIDGNNGGIKEETDSDEEVVDKIDDEEEVIDWLEQDEIEEKAEAVEPRHEHNETCGSGRRQDTEAGGAVLEAEAVSQGNAGHRQGHRGSEDQYERAMEG